MVLGSQVHLIYYQVAWKQEAGYITSEVLDKQHFYIGKQITTKP